MTESLDYIEDDEKGSGAEIKLSSSDAKELRKKLSDLNLLKLKQEYISEIIDILPENQENLNKIFTDVSLDEDESKKVLDVIKEFR